MALQLLYSRPLMVCVLLMGSSLLIFAQGNVPTCSRLKGNALKPDVYITFESVNKTDKTIRLRFHNNLSCTVRVAVKDEDEAAKARRYKLGERRLPDGRVVPGYIYDLESNKVWEPILYDTETREVNSTAPPAACIVETHLSFIFFVPEGRSVMFDVKPEHLKKHMEIKFAYFDSDESGLEHCDKHCVRFKSSELPRGI